MSVSIVIAVTSLLIIALLGCDRLIFQGLQLYLCWFFVLISIIVTAIAHVSASMVGRSVLLTKLNIISWTIYLTNIFFLEII
jgi:hypothetical protein